MQVGISQQTHFLTASLIVGYFFPPSGMVLGSFGIGTLPKETVPWTVVDTHDLAPSQISEPEKSNHVLDQSGMFRNAWKSTDKMALDIFLLF